MKSTKKSETIEDTKLLLDQRNAELSLINSVQEGLVAERSMQDIYDLVGDKIQHLFDAQVVGISTFDHEKQQESFKYLYENGEKIDSAPRAIDKIRQRLISTKKLLDIKENSKQAYIDITGSSPTSVPGTEYPKSMIYVPMLLGNKVLGYVTLQNLDREHAFSDSDIRLLNTLTNSMSVALENARLFNETEQRNAELAVINSVQEGLVAEMDMNGIYELVGDKIRDLFDAQVTGIATINSKTEIEQWQYLFEDGKQFFPEDRKIDLLRKKIISERKALLLNENAAQIISEINGKTHKPLPGTKAAKSALFVPMLVGDMPLGYVTLQNFDKNYAFNDSDVRLLSTLVNSMTVAIENARLFNETTRLLDETEQRASELQTVNSISKAMVSQLEFKSLVELVGKQMLKTFKADIVYLALHDRKTNILHFPYIHGETAESRTFANGITEKIILKKEPHLINHNVLKASTKIKADVKGKMVQSFLGVPIITGKDAIGVISIQSTELKNRFNEFDQRLLSTISANLGIAIQNAEAYQNLQAALTELKATQQQLVQSEKMASLGELTAGIAHEIQNPLNFVNNFSEVSKELLVEMLDELKSGDTEEVNAIAHDVIQNLEKILHHGQRADSIVKGMLQHSQKNSGKKEATDINVLVDEYLRLAYHGVRAKDKSFNANLETNFDDAIGKINVIPQDIGRVVLNIITNAFYALAEQKMLIEKDQLGLDAYHPTIKIITKKENDHIQITISDNGNGIPKHIIDKIFQPFFTTKPTGQGTGLGLSLSYDIIQAHGGTLKVNSELGKGTNFIINLPINN